MWDETQSLCGCSSSLKTRKFRIILPWSLQHERVWCSTGLATIQSSWEVNCNSPPGIQPSPPVPPTPLLLRAEVSQVEPQALRDTDIHKSALPLFYLSVSLMFAEFPSWPRQFQARQVFAVANHLTPLGVEKTKCISWLQLANRWIFIIPKIQLLILNMWHFQHIWEKVPGNWERHVLNGWAVLSWEGPLGVSWQVLLWAHSVWVSLACQAY